MMQAASNLTLPGDLGQCHALIEQLMLTIRAQEQEKERLSHRLEQLLRDRYGRRSEKVDPAQLLLFIAPALAAVVAGDIRAEAQAEPAAPAPKKKGHGRKLPPAELPRIRVEHPVAEKDKVCPNCNIEKKRIGEVITEQIEYFPACLAVIEHAQPKLACPCCEEGVTVAAKPAQPIEKGLPGPGMLAQVIVSKYGDHLPLYRQEAIFARQGLELSRKTMCGWVLAGASVLGPVVDLMCSRVIESKVIHTDDTPVTVREPGRAGTHKGRFWVYVGDEARPYTVFDYTPSRRRDGPAGFLREFTGTGETPRYLQADAFAGYDAIYVPDRGVLEAACWAHARRKFHDARNSDVNRAHTMLALIKLLYNVEREAREKELDADQRRDLRREKAKPLLAQIGEWLNAEQGRVLPKSPVGEAIQYTLNNWKALNTYLGDGDVDIDNNKAENALRGIAIGRKNWLFAGSDRGGHAAAVFYSLITSAKRHGLDSFVYLRDLFLRIPAHPNKQIHLLLPDIWKREILPTLDLSPRTLPIATT